MRKKRIKRILVFISITIIIVWAIGFLGYWGVTHTLVVMGLIIAGLLLVFVGVMTEDDFI